MFLNLQTEKFYVFGWSLNCSWATSFCVLEMKILGWNACNNKFQEICSQFLIDLHLLLLDGFWEIFGSKFKLNLVKLNVRFIKSTVNWISLLTAGNKRSRKIQIKKIQLVSSFSFDLLSVLFNRQVLYFYFMKNVHAV